MLEKEKC
jgi:tousled-like kinase